MNDYESIASNWDLWREYVDPGSVWTRDYWETLSIDDRIRHCVECFGPEEEEEEDL